jgi:hypothetical protein
MIETRPPARAAAGLQDFACVVSRMGDSRCGGVARRDGTLLQMDTQ